MTGMQLRGNHRLFAPGIYRATGWVYDDNGRQVPRHDVVTDDSGASHRFSARPIRIAPAHSPIVCVIYQRDAINTCRYFFEYSA